jgi:LmbE family N-acetylglucosaminyl deacetylase
MTAQPCVVFFHAHPDDEAIFTGGTLVRLAAAGCRTVVVLATGGGRRMEEARTACELLGVAHLESFDYGDSGLWPDDAPEGSFWRIDTREAAGRLVDLLRAHEATSLVVYDEHGIYGHPDHIAVHRVGMAAAALADVPTVYECSVDREYLHFVETHLVGHAVQSLLGMEIAATNTAPLGVPTVLVSTTIDVRDVCATKRAAMAAHASQIPPGSESLTMDAATFEGVYGYEWYTRTSGPRGPLDHMGF